MTHGFSDLDDEYKRLDVYTKQAVENTYKVLNGTSIDDIIQNASDEEMVWFIEDPFDDDFWPKAIDELIEHYTHQEWYERCAELIKLKESKDADFKWTV